VIARLLWQKSDVVSEFCCVIKEGIYYRRVIQGSVLTPTDAPLGIKLAARLCLHIKYWRKGDCPIIGFKGDHAVFWQLV